VKLLDGVSFFKDIFTDLPGIGWIQRKH